MAGIETTLGAILNKIISSFAIDAVGVFSQDYRQVFNRARPIKVVVRETAKLMRHPLETGATIIDHRVIEPVGIEMSMVLQAADYRDTYQQIKQLFLNADKLIVQTKTGVYQNQVIAEMPHEEDPALYDAITIALKLEEALFIQTLAVVQPKNPVNNTTVRRGDQLVQDATTDQTTKSSNLLKIFKKFV